MTPVVRDLARLVALPTVSDRPVTELAATLAERHRRQGMRVERFDAAEGEGKCNLLASVGPEGTGGLVLTGHMDVVPTAGQPWRTDPFRLTEREGRLYGRGTADMKGFLAATLCALDRIRPDEYRRELVCVWTHDEEVGCLGSAWLVDRLMAEGRELPRACLVGEPTGFRILRMHPGHVTLTITLTGRAAHSSRPELGANAIEAAAQVVEAVRELAHELRLHPADLPEMERPWVAVNVARILGGSAINIVPDRCAIEVGYRHLPGMPPEQIFDVLRDRIAHLVLPEGTRADLRIDRVTPALLTPEGTPLQALLKPHATSGRAGAATFATDGGNLARMGLEPLIFGPGDIGVAHMADEYIEQRDLERAVDVIEQVVRARCCA